jgi:glycosyltransferase involved in cell wall biosynthesis
MHADQGSLPPQAGVPLGGSAGGVRTAVLHIGMNLITGPWAVLRELAMAQQRSRRYGAVAIGVITDKAWPSHYADELASFGLPYYRTPFPLLPFGTASVLYQVVRRPGIERWVADLAEKSRCRRVVVHSHNAWLSGAYLPLRAVPGVEVVFVTTFHSVNSYFRGQPLRKQIHRWLARRLPRYGSRLVSVDAFNVPVAEEVLGIRRELFTVIHNGTAASPHRACPTLRGSDVFTLGHVGSIMERKGWRIAGEAVVRLARAGRRVRLLIAGAGEEAEDARRFAAEHVGVVEFLGAVPEARETVMPRLDALSMMSVHEGLPMSIVEAMAVGLPVIATNVGGIAEAVGDGRTGLLIDRSVDALTAAIERLIADRAHLAALSDNSSARFREEFDIHHAVERYDRVYNASTAQNES